MPGLAKWHLDAGAVQVVEDLDRSGSSLLTLQVDDLDDLRDGVGERGVDLGDATEGVVSRIASLTDPAGSVVTFAEPTQA